MPDGSGKLTLQMISNRGTKVYPPPMPPITMVNWYRCRYTADSPVATADILALLNELVRRGIRWMHVELLHVQDGVPMFSKAQGE